MTEDIRLALFIKSLRDTLPNFAFAASLLYLLRMPTSQAYTILNNPVIWFGGITFLFFCTFLIPLQYQHGVIDAQKFKEFVAKECITDLDMLITKPLQISSDKQERKLKFVISDRKNDALKYLDIPDLPRDYFSAKNLHTRNPGLNRLDLLSHIELLISNGQLTDEKRVAHFVWLRETIKSEAGALKDNRPLVSEWIISALSIFVSTALTKLSENIFIILSK